MTKDIAVIKSHLIDRINYPATKNDIVAASAKISYIPPTEKQLFIDRVPNGTYKNADDVIRAADMA